MIKFITDNWVLLLILAIIIYLVVKYYKSTKSKEDNLVNNAQNSITSAITKNISSDKGSVEVVTKTTPIVPLDGSDFANWKIGDKLYAGSLGTNTYSVPNISQTTIVKFHNKNEFIGTYLANENGFAKIIVQTKPDALQTMFGYSNVQVVYSKINQIYKK